MVVAILMVLAGVVFVSTGNILLLLVAATVGVISPSGNEIGPFLSVEQAALSQIVRDEDPMSSHGTILQVHSPLHWVRCQVV